MSRRWELSVAALFAPFAGWFVGLPSYVRTVDAGDWVEPWPLTWALTAPFAGWFVFALLTLLAGRQMERALEALAAALGAPGSRSR